MLNYIWLALIVIGIFVAVGSDWHDLSANKYHNGEEIPVIVRLTGAPSVPLQEGMKYSVELLMTPQMYGAAYRGTVTDTIRQTAEFTPAGLGVGSLHIFLDDKAPSLWKEISGIQKNDNYLFAKVRLETGLQRDVSARMQFDPVKFTKLNAVTNDGIIKSAKTAVELAIGLIGIMVLWLGVMKIADQSGLVSKLAMALKPIMTRLFPDVPADHPAMGAMIMNISANVLGLANAATPFGLKAMEELNKLNKKLGTATDAMCTFLVINTSNVQLIPATVIGIRAAAGSANPAQILGPVLAATFVSLVVGVTTVKLLAKLKVYQKQLSEGV